MNKKKMQRYNDGVITIYTVGNIAEPGNMPKEGIVEKVRLRFRRRTIGHTRFHESLQQNVKIDEIVRCPYRAEVSTQDKAMFLGCDDKFEVKKVVFIENTRPKEMELLLERVDSNYDND